MRMILALTALLVPALALAEETKTYRAVNGKAQAGPREPKQGGVVKHLTEAPPPRRAAAAGGERAGTGSALAGSRLGFKSGASGGAAFGGGSRRFGRGAAQEEEPPPVWSNKRGALIRTAGQAPLMEKAEPSKYGTEHVMSGGSDSIAIDNNKAVGITGISQVRQGPPDKMPPCNAGKYGCTGGGGGASGNNSITPNTPAGSQ